MPLPKIKKPRVTPAMIRKIGEEVILEQFGSLSIEDIRSQMNNIVEGKIRSLYLSFLGLERDDWGRDQYKVKTTANNPFRAAIEKRTHASIDGLQGAANDVLDAVLKDYMADIKLSKKEVEALQACYKEAYLYTLNKRVEAIAQAQAEIDAEAMCSFVAEPEGPDGSP